MRLNRTGAECLGVAVAAAWIYGRTIAPTVGAGDSGELILAAQALGVPHPPGYPLWTMLAHLATLVPFGSIALRVNALSVVLSAAAVGVFHLLARRSGLRSLPAAMATAIFGVSTLVWRSAVEAEVYPLSTLFFLLLTLLALQARSHRASAQSDAACFFVAGLALLAHQTLLFPALFLGGWVLSRGFTPGRALAAAGWAALGASLLFFVPIREAAHPAFAWKAAAGWASFLDEILRRGYGGLRQNPYRFDRFAGEIWGMGALVAAGVGIVGSLLAAAGALVAGRERSALRVVALAALTVPAALAVILVFTPDAEHFAQMAPFLAPVAASLALLAGAGVSGVLRRAPRPARVAAAVSLAALVLATGALHYGACDRSGFRVAERYGRDLLRGLPPDAMLILDGDNETFLAAYATRVEGLRPDVTLIHRRGYLFGDSYGLSRVPRSRWVEIANRVDLVRLETSTRPVYYASPPADLIAAGVAFVPEGLLYRALSPGTSPAGRWVPDSAWPKSSVLLASSPRRFDFVTRKLAVSYSDAAARAFWDSGRYEAALPWFQDAALVGYDFPGAHINLATAAAASGDPELALTELLTARTLAPFDPEPAARLAVFLAAAGRPHDAAVWFEKAYDLGPTAALAGDAARAWTKAGNPGRADLWRARASLPAPSEVEAAGFPGAGRMPG